MTSSFEALGTIAVVGGSLSGLRSIEALRRLGYTGKVVWIGTERHQPYDRPPLSKQLLDGSWDQERVALRAIPSFEALAVETLFGCPATSLDVERKQVALDDGRLLDYDGLIIATGARARELDTTTPAHGVHTLRTLDDALQIRRELENARQVVIVGAGFIGLEVAAVCRKRNLRVRVVDALDRALTRSVRPAVSARIEHLHREQGVEFLFGRSVRHFDGTAQIEQVILDDGSSLPADLVIVGIGARPNTEWLENTGLDISNGVMCDACGFATPAHEIVAAGDVARWFNPLLGAALRTEHWTGAIEQAQTAAHSLLHGRSRAQPLRSVPYVWSDQYRAKLQSIGHYTARDTEHVAEASSNSLHFVALYERAGLLAAATTINRPALANRLRALIASNAGIDEAFAAAQA